MSDAQFTVVNHDTEQTFVEDSRSAADDKKQNGISEFGFSEEDFDIVSGAFESYAEYEERDPETDGGETAVVESEPEDAPQDTEWTPGDEGTPAAAAAAAPDDGPTLKEDPIGYLRNINDDFTNTVKGTPAISKRGFRYIQAELNITTETEVVGFTDDPYGVVVWARAELPDGRAAEAHGEGYPSESGMDKGEWVRYADTRAKNRALSDLTSAGALAVDELKGGIDD